MKSERKFVIQKHTTANDVHWDLMLEKDATLQTYRLELPPEKLANQSSTAIKIFDHQLKFLTYQGSVNQGQGSVQIADAGTYRLISDNNDCQKMEISGEILKGNFALTNIKDNKWKFSSQ